MTLERERDAEALLMVTVPKRLISPTDWSIGQHGVTAISIDYLELNVGHGKVANPSAIINTSREYFQSSFNSEVKYRLESEAQAILYERIW